MTSPSSSPAFPASSFHFVVGVEVDGVGLEGWRSGHGFEEERDGRGFVDGRVVGGGWRRSLASRRCLALRRSRVRCGWCGAAARSRVEGGCGGLRRVGLGAGGEGSGKDQGEGQETVAKEPGLISKSRRNSKEGEAVARLSSLDQRWFVNAELAPASGEVGEWAEVYAGEPLGFGPETPGERLVGRPPGQLYGDWRALQLR